MILNVHWAIELSLGKSTWLLFGCYRPSSWPQYLGLALVFVWGGALRESLISVLKSFLLVLVEFSFWRGGGGGGGRGWARGYHSMGFIHLPDISHLLGF